MLEEARAEAPFDRVKQLLSKYGDPAASVAYLLCDRYDSTRIAYRVVGPDLSVTELSYGTLSTESRRLAAGLAAEGYGRGDRIATLMDKGVEYLTTLIAIWRLGGVHVPLFTAFAAPAIEARLIASGAKLVVCDSVQRTKLSLSESRAELRILSIGDADEGDLDFSALLTSESPELPTIAVGGQAPFIQIYTSGTTGSPKGVVVPVRALASFRAYAEFALDLRDDDVFWNAADPGWGYGLYFGVLAALSTGVTGIFVTGGFSAAATFAVLDALRVTNFTAAPTVYRSLRNADDGAHIPFHLRCASSAGEPLTPDINGWAVRNLGIAVHDHYGQTETGMLINNHHHPALNRGLVPTSMGRAMPGWIAAVLCPESDDIAPVGIPGRLAFDLTQSPLAWFTGYVGDTLKSAEKTSPDGRWYYSGDVARVDSDGNFYFASRDDDLILMAGYRIGPHDVESTILQHPCVLECAVVAVPDDIRGEVLEAVVVLREGIVASESLTAEIKERVKTGFAAHAYPRRVHYVDDLPKTASGKIQRFAVRKRLRDEFAAQKLSEA